MKIIRLKNHLTVILDNGDVLTDTNCTDDLFNSVMQYQDDEEKVKCLINPEFCSKKEEIEEKKNFLKELNSSKYLSTFASSIYIKSISELTVPEDLAVAIFKAEKEGNEDKLQSYLNFWTLASMNPDSRARANLFWFLDKYGMKISKSGLFVAYRNVNLKKQGSEINSSLAEFISSEYSKIKFKHKKSPKNYDVFAELDEKETEEVLLNVFKTGNYSLGSTDPVEPKIKEDFEKWEKLGNLQEMYEKLANEEVSTVYTDNHTRTFDIKIGHPVSMSREDCDPVQENTCSRGLHVAGRDWIRGHAFGTISIMCLVNPADVVAVPPSDSYGKMRTCAYYPVKVVERNEEGVIIDDEIEDGFEDDFLSYINYKGEINNEDEGNYQVDIPETPEISRSRIVLNLEKIRESLKKKQI